MRITLILEFIDEATDAKYGSMLVGTCALYSTTVAWRVHAREHSKQLISQRSLHDPRRKAVPDAALPNACPPPKGLPAGLLPEPFHAARALLPGLQASCLCGCSRLLSSP